MGLRLRRHTSHKREESTTTLSEFQAQVEIQKQSEKSIPEGPTTSVPKSMLNLFINPINPRPKPEFGPAGCRKDLGGQERPGA